MSFQIETDDDSPRRRSQRSFWNILGFVVIAGMVVSIPITYRISRSAQARLSRVQELSKQLDDMASLRLEANRDDRKTELLIRSFQHPGMPEALTKAFESTKLQSVYVCRTSTDWSNSRSFYLYSPDETQELVIGLNLWAGNMILQGGKKTYPNGIVAEVLIEPLIAGKLHLLSYGIVRDKDDTTFRVTLDDRELYSKEFANHFNGSSSSSFNNNQPFGILRPNTLENRYANYDHVIQSERWLELTENTYQFTNRQKPVPTMQTISISAALRSDAALYIPHELHDRVSRELDLRWDDETKRYEILGTKDPSKAPPLTN